jgi:hypothetical protein
MSLGETYEKLRESPAVAAGAGVVLLFGLLWVGWVVVSMSTPARPADVPMTFFCENCKKEFGADPSMLATRPPCPTCQKTDTIKPYPQTCPSCKTVFTPYYTRPTPQLMSKWEAARSKPSADIPMVDSDVEYADAKRETWYPGGTREAEKIAGAMSWSCPSCNFKQDNAAIKANKVFAPAPSGAK